MKNLYSIIISIVFYTTIFFSAILVGLIILTLLTSSNQNSKSFENNDQEWPENTDLSFNDNINYYYLDDGDIFVAEFDSSEKIFYANPIPAQRLLTTSIENNYKLALTGGYFLGDSTHAGYLKTNGEKLKNIARADKQVTHIVEIGSGINFYPASIFDENITVSSHTYFQTGPLLINSNQIQYDLIVNSINGGLETYRTALGKNEDGKIYFVATKARYLLKEFTEIILNAEIFKNSKVSFVNLDGGSSTSIYSKYNKDFRLGTAKVLPFILGVKD